MLRRRTSEEKNITVQASKKKNLGCRLKMKLSYLKVCLGAVIFISIVVFIYLYNKTPEEPSLMSPEMQALYKEHGPGEAKARRRPDINDEEERTKSIETEADDLKMKGEGGMDKTEKRRKEDIKYDKKTDPEKGGKEMKIGNEEKQGIVADEGFQEAIAVEDVPSKRNKDTADSKTTEERIHVAIVACGDRAPEAINSLKSFAMLTKRKLHFHIFAEDELHKSFEREIKNWPGFRQDQIELDILPIQFPGEGDFHEWKKLFKPCASQRLFLPLILKQVDSIIYVDTDVLMLRPPEDLWSFFKQFNETQLAALAPEGEVPAIGWYNRFARHPYYGALGVNSGVMLLNMTRMRQINWNNGIYPIFTQYRYDITWGDQDILNILFHFHPEMLYVFPCDWNYRPDHCMYGNNCQTAITNGVSVVHGNRGVFHNNKQPEFKVIYDAFKGVNFGESAKHALKSRIQNGLEVYKKTYCGENRFIFSKLL